MANRDSEINRSHQMAATGRSGRRLRPQIPISDQLNGPSLTRPVGSTTSAGANRTSGDSLHKLAVINRHHGEAASKSSSPGSIIMSLITMQLLHLLLPLLLSANLQTFSFHHQPAGWSIVLADALIPPPDDTRVQVRIGVLLEESDHEQANMFIRTIKMINEGKDKTIRQLLSVSSAAYKRPSDSVSLASEEATHKQLEAVAARLEPSRLPIASGSDSGSSSSSLSFSALSSSGSLSGLQAASNRSMGIWDWFTGSAGGRQRRHTDPGPTEPANGTDERFQELLLLPYNGIGALFLPDGERQHQAPVETPGGPAPVQPSPTVLLTSAGAGEYAGNSIGSRPRMAADEPRDVSIADLDLAAPGLVASANISPARGGPANGNVAQTSESHLAYDRHGQRSRRNSKANSMAQAEESGPTSSQHEFNIKLEPMIEFLDDGQSTLEADGKVCQLIESGVHAIVGPIDGASVQHVQSICDNLEIPYFELRPFIGGTLVAPLPAATIVTQEYSKHTQQHHHHHHDQQQQQQQQLAPSSSELATNVRRADNANNWPVGGQLEHQAAQARRHEQQLLRKFSGVKLTPAAQLDPSGRPLDNDVDQSGQFQHGHQQQQPAPGVSQMGSTSSRSSNGATSSAMRQSATGGASDGGDQFATEDIYSGDLAAERRDYEPGPGPQESITESAAAAIGGGLQSSEARSTAPGVARLNAARHNNGTLAQMTSPTGEAGPIKATTFGQAWPQAGGQHQHINPIQSDSFSTLLLQQEGNKNYPTLSSTSTTSNKLEDLTLNLYPPSHLLTSAYIDLIYALNWTSFAIVYEEGSSMIKLQDLFKESSGSWSSRWKIRLFRYDPSSLDSDGQAPVGHAGGSGKPIKDVANGDNKNNNANANGGNYNHNNNNNNNSNQDKQTIEGNLSGRQLSQRHNGDNNNDNNSAQKPAEIASADQQRQRRFTASEPDDSNMAGESEADPSSGNKGLEYESAHSASGPLSEQLSGKFTFDSPEFSDQENFNQFKQSHDTNGEQSIKNLGDNYNDEISGYLQDSPSFRNQQSPASNHLYRHKRNGKQNGSTFRDVFWRIKLLGETNILLDVKAENLYTALKQAQQVGCMTEDYSYLITSLDLHTIDLEDFKYSRTRITGFSLLQVAKSHRSKITPNDSLTKSQATKESSQSAEKLDDAFTDTNYEKWPSFDEKYLETLGVIRASDSADHHQDGGNVKTSQRSAAGRSASRNGADGHYPATTLSSARKSYTSYESDNNHNNNNNRSRSSSGSRSWSIWATEAANNDQTRRELLQSSPASLSLLPTVDRNNEQKLFDFFLHQQEDDLSRIKLSTSSAILHDSLILYMLGLNELDPHGNFLGNRQTITCSLESQPWSHGSSMVNYMRQISFNGLTGAISFDQRGFRNNFKLDVMGMAPNMRLVKVGEWHSRRSNDFRRYTYDQSEGLANKSPQSDYPPTSGDKSYEELSNRYQIELDKYAKMLANGQTIQVPYNKRVSPNGALLVNEIIFERLYRNQADQIDTLVVTAKLSQPYFMLKETPNKLDGNDQFEGYAVDLIHELSKLVNFKYKWREVADKKYGSKETLPNGTVVWNGMIGEIVRGVADLAIVDLTITAQRESAVDFTLPFMNTGISILFKKPTTKVTTLFSFLSPFSSDVWAYVLAAYCGISAILFLVGHLSPYEWADPHPCRHSSYDDGAVLKNQFSLLNSFWFTIGSLMQQGSDLTPRSMSTRTIAGIWYFFTLIMISSYTANLAAFLTVEKVVYPIENVRDLSNQQEIKYGCVESGSTCVFFHDSQIDTYKKIDENMRKFKTYVRSNDEGQKRVGEGKFAFFMESTTIEYIIERNCNLTQIGGLIDSKGYGLATSKKSRHKRPYRTLLNEGILHLQETGMLHVLKNRWWKERRGGGTCTDDGKGGGVTELSLANVGGVFVVLLGGLGISFLVAIAEFMWRARRSGSTRDRMCEEMMNDLKFALACKSSTKPNNKTTGRMSKQNQSKQFMQLHHEQQEQRLRGIFHQDSLLSQFNDCDTNLLTCDRTAQLNSKDCDPMLLHSMLTMLVNQQQQQPNQMQSAQQLDAYMSNQAVSNRLLKMENQHQSLLASTCGFGVNQQQEYRIDNQVVGDLNPMVDRNQLHHNYQQQQFRTTDLFNSSSLDDAEPDVSSYGVWMRGHNNRRRELQAQKTIEITDDNLPTFPSNHIAD